MNSTQWANDIFMTKILLADDHSIIRTALKTIVENNITGVAIEETTDGDMVLEKIQGNKYDLLILDINMPGLGSVDLIEKILAYNPEARILIFSMNPDTPFAKMYLKLGVMGYLTKTSSPAEIIKAIRDILKGKVYVSEKVQADIQDAPFMLSANPFEQLSPRELEILQYILRGESVKEICGRSGLNSSTVSTYKARIYEKLGTRNFMEINILAKAHHIL